MKVNSVEMEPEKKKTWKKASEVSLSGTTLSVFFFFFADYISSSFGFKFVDYKLSMLRFF